MLLIDERAEAKLASVLEAHKLDPETSRCIYFHLSNKPTIAGVKDAVIHSASKHIATSQTQIYFCDDGDICVIAPEIATKEGHHCIAEIATAVGMEVSKDWVGFYDLSVYASKLLLIIEHKIEKRRKEDDLLRRQLEQQQTERKRAAILNGGTKVSADTIKSQRISRQQPQVMMIEDDAFSRRLVENVLKKNYALTGLSEATDALDTYARLAPDLLFLDINLPDVTGHELLEKIIALDPDAYVVMLSGNADKENITQAIRKGAKGFVAKPFTREKLFQYIDRCPTIAHV